MPGSLVSDANDITLQASAAVTSTSNTTSVSTAGLVLGTLYRLETVIAAVTGTTPTLDILLQGSDDSSFATGVVAYGRDKQYATADANSTHYLEFVPQHQNLRLAYTAGGTTPSFTITVKVRECNFKRTKGDAA